MTENVDADVHTDSEPRPVDTFKIVGNEIRTEILQTLGEISIQDKAYHEVPFTELRSRVDADLDTSGLNYHLRQLVGHYVEKGEDGYHLRPEGIHLYRAIRAGRFDKRDKQVSLDAGFDCYYCNAPVTANFDRGIVKISCSACRFTPHKDTYTVPPLETFEDAETAFAHYTTYNHARSLGWAYGICHICGNELDAEMIHPNQRGSGGAPRSKVLVERSCENCGAWLYQNVGQALLTDPELVLFCYEHGVDLLSTPYWELEFVVTGKHLTVRSTDPWEVALEVTYEGETLELVVDGDLTVVERNRTVGPDSTVTTLLEEDTEADSTQWPAVAPNMEHGGEETHLPNSTTCVRTLRSHRWPDGVQCPNCEGTDIIKDGKTGKNTQRYTCHDCERSFNDLTGTVFAERGLTLPEMFYIIDAMDETNTAEIARNIDRSYKTVLDFVHEVRDARDQEADVDFPSVE